MNRVVVVDWLRGLALLGILVNHVFLFSRPEAATALQDYPAIGFIFLSGVTAAITKPSTRHNLSRAIWLIIFGIILGAFTGPVAVILLNIGLIMLTYPVVRRLIDSEPRVWLAILYGLAGLFVCVTVTHAINGIWAYSPLSFSPQYLIDDPLRALSMSFFATAYPVVVWMWAYYFGYLAGKHRIWEHELRPEIAAYALGGTLLAKVSGVLAVGWASSWAITNPVAASMWSPAPYSTGLFAMITAICLVTALLAVIPVARNLTWVVRLGQSTLTLYFVHVIIHTLLVSALGGWQLGSWESLIYYGLTVAGMVGFCRLWDRYQSSRGPLEALVTTLPIKVPRHA